MIEDAVKGRREQKKGAQLREKNSKHAVAFKQKKPLNEGESEKVTREPLKMFLFEKKQNLL